MVDIMGWLKECLVPIITKLGFANLPIGSSHVSVNKSEPYVYVRDETHDNINFDTLNAQLFVDCLDNPSLKREYTAADVRPPEGYTPKLLTDLNYHHVTYAALTYHLRKEPLDELSYRLSKRVPMMEGPPKSKFCGYMFKNRDWGAGKLRHGFFKTLSSIKKVDDIQGKARYSVHLFNEAVKLLAPYRFAISFENGIMGGYVTEKIINAFLAGCIPIYRGHPDIYKYFNKSAFINADDFKNLEDLAKYVVEVDENDELYNEYIYSFPSSPSKLRELFWYEDEEWT